MYIHVYKPPITVVISTLVSLMQDQVNNMSLCKVQLCLSLEVSNLALLVPRSSS